MKSERSQWVGEKQGARPARSLSPYRHPCLCEVLYWAPLILKPGKHIAGTRKTQWRTTRGRNGPERLWGHSALRFYVRGLQLQVSVAPRRPAVCWCARVPLYGRWAGLGHTAQAESLRVGEAAEVWALRVGKTAWVPRGAGGTGSLGGGCAQPRVSWSLTLGRPLAQSPKLSEGAWRGGRGSRVGVALTCHTGTGPAPARTGSRRRQRERGPHARIPVRLWRRSCSVGAGEPGVGAASGMRPSSTPPLGTLAPAGFPQTPGQPPSRPHPQPPGLVPGCP